MIRVDDGSIIGGELPKTAARLVEEWRAAHEAELAQNWILAQVPAALLTIEPFSGLRVWLFSLE